MALGLQKAYLFNDANDFVFDEATVEIAAAVARLKMNQSVGAYSQDFSSATGFTYDSALAEFVAGVLRQKDQRAANALVGATYTSSKDLNWAQSGTLTANDVGTPVLSGGKLVCLGGGNNGVRYDGAPEVGTSAGNIGAIRLRYTPNYSGTPAANYNIVEFSSASGNAGKMVLLHSASGGTLRLTAYTSAATIKHSAVVFGAAWSPVAGTEYELELNWDTIAGTVRLFVNGVLQGAMPVSSYDRGTAATRLHVGAGLIYTATDGSFNDVQVFSAVQHTAGYTPGYTVPENIFLASVAVLPEFAHVGPGKFLSVTDFVVSDTASPRYTVEIGQSGTFLYWNGSAWVASNGTYAQANDGATFDTNAPSLPVNAQAFLKFRVHFTGSNSQQAITSALFSILETTGFPSDAEKIFPNEKFLAGEITSFAHVVDSPAGTAVRYTLEVDSVEMYWNGVSFSESNGTFAQTNTMQEIMDHALLVLDGSQAYVRPIVYIKSDDPYETPEVTSATFVYDEDVGGARGFLDSILAEINAESLTDAEFDAFPVDVPAYDRETYLGLRAVLEARENISDQVKRLKSYFEAKGVDVSATPNIPTPASQIFIGSGL